VREIELEIEQIKQRSKQNESTAVQRMKLIESEILRVKSDSEQIEARTKQIESETEQIKSETEQLRLENARLKARNAKGRALLSFVDQHCFPPACSSIPPQPNPIAGLPHPDGAGAAGQWGCRHGMKGEEIEAPTAPSRNSLQPIAT
jgi:hypothetical protein